jgi:NADPH:quinone reductase-like Zn-dependent oxidoreductase
MLALQGLVDIGRIQQGEKILINGAGGGVGSFGVQIAKRYGAEVTGVDSAAKLPTLEALGFDHVIDYRKTDFTQSEQRYDLILDAKTTRSPHAYLRALKPGGRYVTVGGLPSKMIQLLTAAPLISGLANKRLHILALKPNHGIAYMNDMFERGELRFVIDGPYSLDELPSAMQRFGDAEHIGKVVITVPDTRAAQPNPE